MEKRAAPHPRRPRNLLRTGTATPGPATRRRRPRRGVGRRGAAVRAAADDVRDEGGDAITKRGGEDGVFFFGVGVLVGEGVVGGLEEEAGGVEDVDGCCFAVGGGWAGVAADDEDLAVVEGAGVPCSRWRGGRGVGDGEPGEGGDGEDVHGGVLRLLALGRWVS